MSGYDELIKYNQFILYKLTPKKSGKPDKKPVDYRTLQVFVSGSNWLHDPINWTTFKNASTLASLSGPEYGVGFVLTDKDPFFFVDIDNCAQPDGTWSQIANILLHLFSGALVETSISGTGLHIIATGDIPDHSCKNSQLGLELYHQDRFIALGNMETAIGDIATDCTISLQSLVTQYFPPKTVTKNITWTTIPTPEYTPFEDDDKLIKKALKSKSLASKFGRGIAFKDLWNNNTEVLSDAYPPITDKWVYDQSSADMALAQHLSFWCGNNCEHILNLMWCSNLKRNKWTYHKKYLYETIIKTVGLQNTVYTRGAKKRTPAQIIQAIDEPVISEGYQFLPATQQLEHFKGCIYVQYDHKIFTPDGSLLKESQFNATYGGYVFQLDNEANGKITKKAWEAFTESQIIRYPKAKLTCFRPNLEQGVLTKEEGQTLVNIYTPIETQRIDGDITPFLIHLEKLLPIKHDRQIIIAYMAACIQHKGFKFQWAPLIQGTKGNGKTLLTRAVAFAVGERYTHWPFASEVSEKFNDWLFNKLLIGIEDVYVAEHKQEVIEILKPMITNDRLPKRAMQQGQIMQWVCANFMLNMNNKSGFKTTYGDRRYAPFYTAQQTKDDLKRDGMNGDYFPKLYRWLRKEGYAIINNYLSGYQIPLELNPALGDVGGLAHRAPETSSSQEAHNMALGAVEQEILEAIEESRFGFSGGWISSMALERLLQTIHASKKIPHNKRREILQSLGYDWHPGLPDGRVSTIIPLDGGKPRLFTKIDHLSNNLTNAIDIVKAYQNAQTSTFMPTIAGASRYHK